MQKELKVISMNILYEKAIFGWSWGWLGSVCMQLTKAKVKDKKCVVCMYRSKPLEW